MKARHKASTIIIESFFISVSSLLCNPFFNKLSHFTIHLSHPFPRSRLSPSLALFNQQQPSFPESIVRQLGHLLQKTRRFRSLPHGWFGFVGILIQQYIGQRRHFPYQIFSIIISSLIDILFQKPNNFVQSQEWK